MAEFERIEPLTLVSIDRCWALQTLLEQALHFEGDVLEAGVYRGGTALLMKRIVGTHLRRKLYLFDSFAGMQETDPIRDWHRPGAFAGTSLEEVKTAVGTDSFIDYRPGWIPATFAGLEEAVFCFAHIDVDLYRSVLDCCAFVYPRLSPRGGMVFDDYGFPSCPGARQAVDEFFADKPEVPLILQTGQAIVFKL